MLPSRAGVMTGGGGGGLGGSFSLMKFKRGLFLIRYQWFTNVAENGMVFPWASGGSAPCTPPRALRRAPGCSSDRN